MFLVLAAGFASGLFIWEVRHMDLLAAFAFRNQLEPEMRRQLALMLLTFTLGSAFVWLLISWLWGWRTQLAMALALQQTLFFIATLLPFLPVLAIDNIEDEAPFLTLFIILGVSMLTYLAASNIGKLVDLEVKSSIVNRIGLLVIVFVCLGCVLFFSAYTVQKHNSFRTTGFDLGIYDQVLYNILHEGRMRFTFFTSWDGNPIISEDHIIDSYDNYLAFHFSPVLYLLAPVYAFYQDAKTLLVFQSIALGLGGVAVYLLAQVTLNNILLASVFGVSYLLYPALHGVNQSDFHGIAMAIPVLLFVFYLLERKKLKLFYVLLVTALLVREDVALTIAAIGLYMIFVKKMPRHGLIVFGLGLAYFLLVTQTVIPYLRMGGQYVYVDRFENMMAEGFNGLGGVMVTAFTNPLYTIVNALQPDKIVYLLQLLVPVLFLPLLAGGGVIVVLPSLATALLASFEPQYQLGYQYSAITIAVVYYLAIVGARNVLVRASLWSKLSKSLRLKKPGDVNPTSTQANTSLDGTIYLSLAAAVLLSSILMNDSYGLLGDPLPRISEHHMVLKSFVQSIPGNASISTMNHIVPHLSSRREIYLFPIVNQADYILFEATDNHWPISMEEATHAILSYIRSGEYGVVRWQEDIVLLKRGHDLAQNQETTMAFLSQKFQAEDMPSAWSDTRVMTDIAEPRDVMRQETARVGKPNMSNLPNYLVYGPYINVYPGEYRVAFYLKVDDNNYEGEVATLDVTSNLGQEQITQSLVSGTDFVYPDQYQQFVLYFAADQVLTHVEFRVYYRGNVTLWVDYIKMSEVSTTLNP